MPDQIDMTLAEILALALGRSVAAEGDLARAEESKWDSLKHLEIIFAVEAAFGVAFSADEIGAVQSLADLKAKVRASHAA